MVDGTPGGAYAGEPVGLATLDSTPVTYDAAGLVPAVVQQEGSGEVLMVAWMNAESLARTLSTGTTWFWSRSRQELWNKGATSGNLQQVRRVLVDCDADTLVVVVDSPGPACHTGHRSCFYRELPLAGAPADHTI
ncbi:MAG: phosphoribosyl-AMP cyclohydrolase [Atopobiaceae bacterium]|jgi:phosphoribosyl-AMP cyclohydrolase/phosphoribosyl-ATP pyrophosphohydrolase/phosphoribosyl-AMP cyclohydrolase|nr:phosphoribosyl-AMP cyclohydrolase [Atopobiaceae bacterium]MCH4180782.1 phosphoribosyl-AMP cyclohydrolase [Atopobiaceae bacterium]MCH4214453.1 phosphoribosyl-AMP cyclohydrolase [Atopobiaceae bacterium]MCH4229383.1 phosphoribosyl-AMP cyclohydrolase [Atopobiaceae bacterium]MCH4276659.1 phosphoribosyl-AMP cyclohydrolase [Atopobiaceae bacterium]